MSNRYLQIACSNKPSDNKMSYKKGVSELIFQIPEQDNFLIPSTVRLCGTIRFFEDIAADPTVASANVNTNGRLGCYGFINAITSRSLIHQTTLEQTRHFNRFMASYLPLSASAQDTLGHLSQSALCSNNYLENQTKEISFNGPTHFAMHLPTGLLTNSEIPLSRQWGIGGLELSITLESDAQFFNAINGNSILPDTYYEIEDPHIVCEVRQPAPDELSQLMKKTSGQLTYQSISSYYDTINSTNSQINFTLGLSKVRSVFCNFIRSSYLSNLSQDGLATALPVLTTNKLANVDKIVWLKGGTQYPKHYPVNTNVKKDVNVLACDPEVVRDYVNAVLPFTKNRALACNIANCNRNWILNATGDETAYTKVNDGGIVWGLGVSYDHLGGNGSDFTQQTWGLAMELDANDDCPNSVFIFANSEQTLVYNQNGVQVLK